MDEESTGMLDFSMTIVIFWYVFMVPPQLLQLHACQKLGALESHI